MGGGRSGSSVSSVHLPADQDGVRSHAPEKRSPKEVFIQIEQDSREGSDLRGSGTGESEVHRESRGGGGGQGSWCWAGTLLQRRDRTTRVAVRQADFPFLEGGLAFWCFSVLQ